MPPRFRQLKVLTENFNVSNGKLYCSGSKAERRDGFSSDISPAFIMSANKAKRDMAICALLATASIGDIVPSVHTSRISRSAPPPWPIWVGSTE